MNEDNLRHNVVTCLCKAIDLEHGNNDVEAYQKYLEGLSMVATALLQSAQGSRPASSTPLSWKERKSLVGFAKQSIDRIVVLLEKQGKLTVSAGRFARTEHLYQEPSQLIIANVVERGKRDKQFISCHHIVRLVMNEDNLRHNVVTCLCKAIDLEHGNNDVEAYQKYLEGLSMVATALLQSAQGSRPASSTPLSWKERKSLVGFAKQSIDRIVVLLEKQEREARCIEEDFLLSFDDIVGTLGGASVDHSKKKPSEAETKASRNLERQVVNISPDKCVEVPPVSLPSLPAMQKEDSASSCESDSPMARLRRENQRLIARYASRLKNASPQAKANLQLELQRRLIENATITRQKQEAWEERKKGLENRCMQLAEQKFNIREKIMAGTITEEDFRKQRIYVASLKFEEDNVSMKLLRQNLLLKPQDSVLWKQTLGRILNDKTHPIGRLVSQMQNSIQNKIYPIILKHQHRLCGETLGDNNGCSDSGAESLEPEIGRTDRLGNLNVNLPSPEKKFGEKDQAGGLLTGAGGRCSLNEAPRKEFLSHDEDDGIRRHLSTIIEDIKQDLKLLEDILAALLEPMKYQEARGNALGCLYTIYFQPLRQYLVQIFRLCTMKEESELRTALGEDSDDDVLDELNDAAKKSASTIIYELIELGSPCEKLDCLVAMTRFLCEEDKKYKSIGADDLLPRLTSVVLYCGVPHLFAEAWYMEAFMPEDRLLGESGYCLTVFQSVLNCIVATGKK